MVYTIDSLLSNPAIVSAVIDRLEVTAKEADKIRWKEYLAPKKANPDGTFKTYYGTQTGVVIGSFIDKYSNKPLRKRHAMSSGYGEVGALGEAYQMDNARLEELQILVDTYNQRGESAVVEEIVNFLVDDMRQCYLAPNKRIDLMLADLKWTGKSAIHTNADQKGVKIIETTLPLKKIEPAASVKGHFITYLAEQIEALHAQGIDTSVLEMSRSTFTKYISGDEEFKSNFVAKFGSFELYGGALATPAMANDLLSAFEIPATIKIVQDYITMQDGKTQNVVPTGKISLLPDVTLGNLRWKTPYELSDKIGTKSYSERENGLFIATQRTEEGRFVEYGCEWIVDIDKPNRMALMDLKNLA